MEEIFKSKFTGTNIDNCIKNLDNFKSNGATGKCLKKSGVVSYSQETSLTELWAKLLTLKMSVERFQSNSEHYELVLLIHSAYMKEYAIVNLHGRKSKLTPNRSFTILCGNINPENLRLYYDKPDDSDDTYELWVNLHRRYGVYKCLVLSETARQSSEYGLSPYEGLIIEHNNTPELNNQTLTDYINPTYLENYIYQLKDNEGIYFNRKNYQELITNLTTITSNVKTLQDANNIRKSCSLLDEKALNSMIKIGTYVVYKQIDGITLPMILTVTNFSANQVRQMYYDIELNTFRYRSADLNSSNEVVWTEWRNRFYEIILLIDNDLTVKTKEKYSHNFTKNNFVELTVEEFNDIIDISKQLDKFALYVQINPLNINCHNVTVNYFNRYIVIEYYDYDSDKRHLFKIYEKDSSVICETKTI